MAPATKKAPAKKAPVNQALAPVTKVHVPEQKVLNIDELVRGVRKSMGIKVFVPDNKFVLKTQWPEMDEAIGTPEGIPYGRIVELSGPESHGKSVIQTLILGEAQRDGAVALKMDVEDSDDEPWNTKLGVSNDELILIKPKMVYEKLTKQQKEENAEAKAEWKEQTAAYRKANPFVLPNPEDAGELRPQSAEELFEEAEGIIKKLQAAGVEKMALGVDSIANLSTESQLKAGMHQNMRTNADLSMFLSGALKQWQILAANYNVLIVLINQIREKPGVMFGDPTYEPGGRALRHNCHSRNRVHRKGDGKVYQAGKLIGINGILKNRKNKMGEGSLEGQMVEYRICWDKRPLKERVTFKTFTKKPKAATTAEE